MFLVLWTFWLRHRLGIGHDAAFYGKNRRYALGNTPQQRFMSRWSDGVPIKELQVLDKP